MSKLSVTAEDGTGWSSAQAVLGHAQSLQSCPTLATPWTAAYQAPPSMDFPGKHTGVGCHRLLWTNHVRSFKPILLEFSFF